MVIASSSRPCFFMKYMTLADLQIRLQNKVRFSADEEEKNAMSEKFAKVLIDEAEAEVELDLSPRYAVPFATKAGLAFSKLPLASRNLIRTLVEIKAVMKVLETDFGRGSVAGGSAYSEKIEQRYDKVYEKLMASREPEGYGWKYPPLPDLMLAPHNTEADDGFKGQILLTEVTGDGGYPQAQINDPAENIFYGQLDEIP